MACASKLPDTPMPSTLSMASLLYSLLLKYISPRELVGSLLRGVVVRTTVIGSKMGKVLVEEVISSPTADMTRDMNVGPNIGYLKEMPEVTVSIVNRMAMSLRIARGIAACVVLVDIRLGSVDSLVLGRDR